VSICFDLRFALDPNTERLSNSSNIQTSRLRISGDRCMYEVLNISQTLVKNLCLL